MRKAHISSQLDDVSGIGRAELEKFRTVLFLRRFVSMSPERFGEFDREGDGELVDPAGSRWACGGRARGRPGRYQGGRTSVTGSSDTAVRLVLQACRQVVGPVVLEHLAWPVGLVYFAAGAHLLELEVPRVLRTAS